jgi:RNA polymerase-interacting CarD/CdnL/TRCF family regulator
MFKVGDEVSYGLHGRCVVTGIQTKQLEQGQLQFYEIRAIKNAAVPRPITKADPQILVPMSTATDQGMRSLMQRTDAEDVLKLLAEPDYHFALQQPWQERTKLLECCLRKEGPKGLAKVVGHLFMVIKCDVGPAVEAQRMYQAAHKALSRELSVAMDITTRGAEELIDKALKVKARKDS